MVNQTTVNIENPDQIAQLNRLQNNSTMFPWNNQCLERREVSLIHCQFTWLWFLMWLLQVLHTPATGWITFNVAGALASYIDPWKQKNLDLRKYPPDPEWCRMIDESWIQIWLSGSCDKAYENKERALCVCMYSMCVCVCVCVCAKLYICVSPFDGEFPGKGFSCGPQLQT